MKTFQKVILPAAMSLAGLTAFEAQALNTTAGIQITNNASMTFQVNSVTQDAVTASASFLVDAKVSLAVTEQGGDVEDTSSTYDPDSTGTDDHYLVGVFQVSNTGNVKTVYDLTLTNIDGSATAVNGINDSKDATDLTGFRFFAGADFLTEITDAAPLTIDKAPDLSNGTSTEVYVYAPMTQITGVNNDSYAFDLQVDAVSLIERLADDTGDAAAKTIASYVAPAVGDELTTVELQIVSQTANAADVIQLAFPDFTPDTGNAANSGFTKTAAVVWDPVNLFASPMAIPGATVKYTITLQNLGSTAADNVIVTDAVPANTEFCNAADGEGCEDLNATDTNSAFIADADATDGLTQGITYSTAAPAAADTSITVSYDQFPAAETSDITFTVKLQ